jgi:PAS domain S-box-containing protein
VSLSLNEPGWPNEFVSDYAPELTGYTAEELSDGSVMFGDLIVEEDRQRVWEEAQRALAGRRRFDLRYAIRRRDGELRHMEDNGQGVYDEEGHLEALEGIVYDVTEHERAEERLREAEVRYRTLVEQVPSATYTYVQSPDGSGGTVYMSPRIASILGYPPEDFERGFEFWERTLHPDDRERVLAENTRTDQTGEPFSPRSGGRTGCGRSDCTPTTARGCWPRTTAWRWGASRSARSIACSPRTGEWCGCARRRSCSETKRGHRCSGRASSST